MSERTRHTTAEMLPDTLAVFPLPGVVLLPFSRLPLNIFEPRYLNMVEDALVHPRLIGMIQPSQTTAEDLVPGDIPLSAVGCAGRIAHFEESEGGRYQITLEGVCRFRVLEEIDGKDGYRRVRPAFAPYASDFYADAERHIPDRDALVEAITAFFPAKGYSIDEAALNETPDYLLVNSMAVCCPLDHREKQALLEAPDLPARAELLTHMLQIAVFDTATTAPEFRQ